MMLHTDRLYLVLDNLSDEPQYGRSPDGEGMYWYYSMKEAKADWPFEHMCVQTFQSWDEFENHRYGEVE